MLVITNVKVLVVPIIMDKYIMTNFHKQPHTVSNIKSLIILVTCCLSQICWPNIIINNVSHKPEFMFCVCIMV